MQNWEENKHPRDEDGKFTTSGGTPAEHKRLQEMGLEETQEHNGLTAEEQRLKEIGINVSTNREYFKEKIDRNNEKELKSKIEGYINRIVLDNKEHCVIIDKNGNVYENTGGDDYVEDIGLNLKGAINIHNHLENGSFEQGDFNFYRDKVGTDFICATPKFIFKLKVLKEIDKPYNYFYRNGMVMTDDPVNQAHNIMEFIKSEGYIEYEKNVRNS